MAFTEQAGERTNARGALSSEQAAKFAGKFMEDEEVDQSGTIDDIVAKMEAALGDKSPAPEPAVDTPPQSNKPNSDGW